MGFKVLRGSIAPEYERQHKSMRAPSDTFSEVIYPDGYAEKPIDWVA